MNMKRIYRSLLLAAVACLPLFTSCDDDNDSNPTLSIPESFVLNTPEFAMSNVYDLPASEFVNLTTSQPDYGGWPAAVTYKVQLSLDGTDEEGWQELANEYTSTNIKVPAAAVNAAVLDMYRAANDDADPEGELPLYVRLRAYLTGNGTNDSFGEVFSNAVALNVISYDTPSDVTLPTAIYVCGNSIDVAWTTWKPLAPVYGKEGRFYTMIYNNADGFKWGFKPNDWFGFEKINEWDTSNAPGLTVSGNDGGTAGDIIFNQTGWFTLEFICKVVGSELQTKVIVSPGQVGVIGNSIGSWDGIVTSMPATKTSWTFNAFTATGELRAYIVVPGEDWWRTEFTMYKGETVYYRDFDIPSDWQAGAAEKANPPKEDPENYSQTVGAGKTLTVNFDNNTGSIE